MRAYDEPRILDVGCGSGRHGELALEAGASEWVGVDFSEPMLELARERTARFGDRARLVHGDFVETDLGGTFDVVFALGLFDYLGEPERFTRRIGELTAPGGSVAASFPRWDWLKGPIRKVRYEVINNCPISDYTEPQPTSSTRGLSYSRRTASANSRRRNRPGRSTRWTACSSS